jgi:hypothetical protein
VVCWGPRIGWSPRPHKSRVRAQNYSATWKSIRENHMHHSPSRRRLRRETIDPPPPSPPPSLLHLAATQGVTVGNRAGSKEGGGEALSLCFGKLARARRALPAGRRRWPGVTVAAGVVTPGFKGKTECIDHVCARIKLHTRLDIMNAKISATRIKSYYKP